MADADLDVVIRRFVKQQHKSLMAAVKNSRTRYAALAARAKDAETKQRYKQLAKQTTEIGTATIKRLQISADNAADSYARSIRQVVESATAKKAATLTKMTNDSADRIKKNVKKVGRKVRKTSKPHG